MQAPRRRNSAPIRTAAFQRLFSGSARRLFLFIRKRVDDEGDAEDILQDVFYELIEAYRLMKPIEQVGSWLYRVAEPDHRSVP